MSLILPHIFSLLLIYINFSYFLYKIICFICHFILKLHILLFFIIFYNVVFHTLWFLCQNHLFYLSFHFKITHLIIFHHFYHNNQTQTKNSGYPIYSGSLFVTTILFPWTTKWLNVNNKPLCGFYVKHLVEQINHKVIEREQQTTLWFLCPTNHFVVLRPTNHFVVFLPWKNHKVLFITKKCWPFHF